MKKLLHIVEAFSGGIITYLTGLVNETCRDFEITVAYSIRENTPADFANLFDPSVKFVQFKHFQRSINPFRDVAAFCDIKKLVRQTCPDIIHLHSSKAGFLGRFAIDGKKISLFYTPNGYSFLMKNCTPVKRMLYQGLELFAGKRICKTIATSKGEYEESLKVSADCTFINNGIDTAVLDRLIRPLNLVGERIEHHGIKIFTLARICEQKNPELFNQIAMEFPEQEFYWIGDGPLRSKLTAPNIKVTGWLDREEALQLVLQMDVFLLPSIWEGLPLSLLEAMYLKKLCIVSDAVGNRDVIENGRNGCLCRNFGGYLAAFEQIIQGGIDQKLVDNAYDDILNEYNTIVMAEKYKLYYQSKNTVEIEVYP